MRAEVSSSARGIPQTQAFRAGDARDATVAAWFAFACECTRLPGHCVRLSHVPRRTRVETGAVPQLRYGIGTRNARIEHEDRIHMPDASADRPAGAWTLPDLWNGTGAAHRGSGTRQSRTSRYDPAVLGEPGVDRATAGRCDG